MCKGRREKAMYQRRIVWRKWDAAKIKETEEGEEGEENDTSGEERGRGREVLYKRRREKAMFQRRIVKSKLDAA